MVSAFVLGLQRLVGKPLQAFNYCSFNGYGIVSFLISDTIIRNDFILLCQSALILYFKNTNIRNIKSFIINENNCLLDIL